MTDRITHLTNKKIVAKDMVELHMVRPEGFDYLAGQFIQFLIPVSVLAEFTRRTAGPGKPQGDAMAKRAYSLASHPGSTDLEICIKLLPGGLASTYFQAATAETPITFSGPQGRFVNTTSDAPLYFVATGAGLGPIMGMITDELKNKKTKEHVHLLFGVRSQEDIFWVDRLDALQEQHPNFSYQLTLSQPQGIWSGFSGRVNLYLPDAVNGSKRFYLCGSPDMVKEVRESLMSRGADPNMIHFEIF